ncbi:MAG: ATP-dependent zinc metalloprotease FtsH [Candidatus Pacebacteria bacterium]|nr:ATP-dependent zinc metalloprotease FtsH [Candidatus Paceibacterota bacterium]
MNKILQNFLLIVLLFIAISAVFAFLNPQALQGTKEISFTQLVQDVNQDKVDKIEAAGNDLTIYYKAENNQPASKAVSIKENNGTLNENLKKQGADETKVNGLNIVFKKESPGVWDWLMPLALILPVVIFGFLFWGIFKQAKTGANQTFSFLKSPAKVFGDGKNQGEKVTFKDVAGVEEAKEEIKEVVDFLKNPQKFLKMGARIPRGVLLIGPPGTGKTLLAKAVANESNVPFFSMSGSEFIELFVGVGASRVRSLFETAKKNQPCIVFIDEIDSIGKIRGVGMGGGHEEREQTLNQILAEMDGFEKNAEVIVFAATNRPEYLDPALLRPGRFDRRIILDLPDIQGREDILKIHCQDKPLAGNVKLREVAERTPGFSGADLSNLVNEAAILAARREKEVVNQTELLESIEKVLLGPERKSHLLSQREKEISAYHEAGHALISSVLPNTEEVRKVSIVSRGMAAGYTLALPKDEKRIKTKSEFLAELAVLLGGYATEKLVFNELSTGASNDLQKASHLARALVTKYGMSKLGPIVFGKRESLPFLGWETETERDYSEKTASDIDAETERFIKEAELKATAVLQQQRKTLERIAKVLIEKETIEKEEFEVLVGIKQQNHKNSRKSKGAEVGV